MLGEEVLEVAAQRADGGEEAIDGAAAAEAEAACFQLLGFLVLREGCDLLRREGGEPGFICIRLCGEEGKGIAGKGESTGTALLALGVVLLDP